MTTYRFSKQVLFTVALLVLALSVAACSASRTPAPTSEPTAVPTSTIGVPTDTPTDAPVNQPVIAISPTSGGPNTPITVVGAGFPANAHVAIRLGPPNAGASLQPYGDALADGAGTINLVFHMPGAWADGTPITGDRVVIVAATDDFRSKATAEFMLQTSGPTPTPSVTPQPTSAVCTDRASLISDVTIPDNTNVAPGAAFVKTWRLRNAGTCTWDTSYALVFASGAQLGGPASVALPGSVAPGGTIDVSVSLTAPSANDTYRGNWLLRNRAGRLFGLGNNADVPVWVQIVVGPKPTPVIKAWRGEYYGNRDLSGAPIIVRDDAEVNFNWGASAPAQGIPANDFSARWMRALTFNAGTYRFYVRSDDGVRVWLNGELIIDQWHDAGASTYSVDRALSSGPHALRVEYYERGGDALAQLWWERLGDFPQWRAEYFSNINLSGAATIVRNDADINFDWSGGAPAQGVPADNFSARWTRTLGFEDATYRFHAMVDDGVRLYVDGALVINEWHDGPWHEVTGEARLAGGNHTVRVEYYERVGGALLQAWWEKVAGSYPDWKGEYWSNRDLSGSPAVTRNDVAIDFNWGRSTPAQLIPADNFSARWTRSADFEAGTYRFHLLVDDGVRLWVDDRLIVDEWRDGSSRELTADVALTQGAHRLKVEYYERIGDARIQMWWEKVAGSYPDWKAEFWTNMEFSGQPLLTRNDAAIDFNWGENAPASGLRKNRWAARWSRTMNFDAGLYRFTAQADDGIRVFVDGNLALNEWHGSSGGPVYTAELGLTGAHTVVVEYFDYDGLALVKFNSKRIGGLPPTVTPTATATTQPATATSTATATATTQPATATATATPTATTQPATATATLTPTVSLRLNEVLSAPGAVDWDGSGSADAQDEWIELTNTGVISVDLGGWALDTSDSKRYVFPAGTLLGPGQLMVFYHHLTGLTIDDNGSNVRLLNPNGEVAHKVTVGVLGADRSYSRDSLDVWHADWSPSPGAVNVSPTGARAGKHSPLRTSRFGR
ncbi:MAG TPA: PA14 domain-containing protein [Anaerolineae bacterium]|nr:PA14 domain-containing protein [Anaerolineae bacterium]